MIPQEGYIIRRCQKCDGLTEIEAALSQVGIARCRACVAEDRVAELLGLLRECRLRLAPLEGANPYGFKVGDAVRIEGEKITYTIKEILPPHHNSEGWWASLNEHVGIVPLAWCTAA